MSTTDDPSSIVNFAQVRQRLLDTFTAGNLRCFCEDRPLFEPLLDYFAPNDNLHEMIDEVIPFCRTRGLFPELLAELDGYTPPEPEPGTARVHISVGVAHPGAQIVGELHIHKPPAPTRIPAMAPSLPEHHVFRAGPFNQIMERLLAKPPADRRVLFVSAIQGLPGVGKSILAAALAADRQVGDRYPDGILWATLGKTPNVLVEMHAWMHELGAGDRHPTTADAATGELATLLSGKDCLLVVDDAWDPEHVRPFMVGAPTCQLLITTRDAELARRLNARLFNLDVMTGAESLALFESRLRLRLQNAQREHAVRLAETLGHLPLALELAAAQIQGGYISWSDLLDVYQDRLAGAGILDYEDPRRPNESLRLSFDFSLQQFSDADRQAFCWLGITPEDAVLCPAASAVLWDQPETEARRRLLRFRDRSLLTQVGEHRYRLHDLLHDEAALRLSQRLPLRAAHDALLDRYRTRTSDSLWHTLPDDGYIHQRLAWHMEHSSDPGQLHALLREQTPDGRNAWFEARERLGQTSGYLADVRGAWRLAEADRDPGLECRYALIVASLSSLAVNLPPELLAVLVTDGWWPASEALAYALRNPDVSQRARSLVALAPHLPAMHLPEALAAACAIGAESCQAEALAGLGPHLTGELLGEALAAARAIAADYARATALAGLGPHLTGELREQVLDEALAAVPAIDVDRIRAEVLAALGSYLTGKQVGRALAAAGAIRDRFPRAMALAGLAPCLTGRLRDQVLAEALAAARAVPHELEKARALATLGPHLTGQLLAEGLVAARGIWTLDGRAQALAALVPNLSGEQRQQILEEALAAARSAGDEWSRARALATVAPLLTGPRRDQALAEAEAAALDMGRDPMYSEPPEMADAGGIGFAFDRAQELAKLVPHLAGEQRRQVLDEALAEARAIGDEGVQAKALAGLGPHLAPELVAEALAGVPAIWDEQVRADALRRLAPHLTGEQLGEARDAALAIRNPYYRDLALGGAHTAGHGWQRSATPAGLSLPLTGEQRAQLLAGALAPESAGWTVGDWIHALSRLGPHLAPAQRDQLQARALAAARAIADERQRADALARLGPHLSPEYIGQALAAARTLVVHRTKALEGLVPHLAPEHLAGALTAVRSIGYKGEREPLLAQLAGSVAGLHPRAIQPLWSTTLPILAARSRSDLLYDLQALAPVIHALGGQNAITGLFRSIQDVGRWWP